jgi:hypothetical protein
MIWASMPKAAIDENCNTRFCKDNVGSYSPGTGDRKKVVLSEPQALAV